MIHNSKFFQFGISALIAGGILLAAERFDYLVRADFFAGMAGDQKALDRAMKLCEERLAQDPKHPEAMVWHGVGLFFLSGKAFQNGDFARGGELWAKGTKEMDTAVELAPDHVGVRIPRGAALLAASRGIPNPEQAKAALTKGLGDYEKVYELQKSYFDTLSGHARGELLFGLAEGYHRLGKQERAREYFEKVLAVGDSSGHQAEAREWMDKGSITRKQITCTGCHTK